MFKKVLLSVLILTGLVTSRADSFFVTNNLAATTNVLLVSTTPFVLTTFSLTTTNDTPTVVLVYDGASSYTNTAYTNWTSYSTNIVTSYLTSTGTTNTVTNTVLYPVASVTAAGTYANTPVFGATVSKTVPFIYNVPNGRFPGTLFYTGRLAINNGAAGTSVLFSYRQP